MGGSQGTEIKKEHLAAKGEALNRGGEFSVGNRRKKGRHGTEGVSLGREGSQGSEGEEVDVQRENHLHRKIGSASRKRDEACARKYRRKGGGKMVMNHREHRVFRKRRQVSHEKLAKDGEGGWEIEGTALVCPGRGKGTRVLRAGKDSVGSLRGG